MREVCEGRDVEFLHRKETIPIRGVKGPEIAETGLVDKQVEGDLTSGNDRSKPLPLGSPGQIRPERGYHEVRKLLPKR